MNKNKSFSNETSERYALALYELSIEKNLVEDTETSVNKLIKVYENSEEFRNFIQNPTNSLNDQGQAMEKLSEIMNFSKIMNNFLQVLVFKRRLFFIYKIMNNFLKISSKNKGQEEAILTSSKKLNIEELKKISEDFSKALGKKINLDFKYDEKLIGGLKIQIGSLMIDTSIKNKLKKYQQILTEK